MGKASITISTHVFTLFMVLQAPFFKHFQQDVVCVFYFSLNYFSLCFHYVYDLLFK